MSTHTAAADIDAHLSVITPGVLTIYGDSGSGNCHKVRAVARYVGVDFTWVEIPVLSGATRRPAFLAINPMGQVPAVRLADGRCLSQSAAIMLHLAEGSDLIPKDAFARAEMFAWLFWEQYSHEPIIAVRRFKKHYLKQEDTEIDPSLLPRGQAVLQVMENRLAQTAWFAGEHFSLADIALAAYTRLAHEGGYDLTPYPALRNWIPKVERRASLG